MGDMARQLVNAVRGFQAAHPDVDWSDSEVMVRYADGTVYAVGHRPRDERAAEAIRRCCCHPDLPRGHERGEALSRRSDPAAPAPVASPDTPCGSCDDTRWVDDENWQPEDWELSRGRIPGSGRIPCGICNHGGWNEPDTQEATPDA